MIEILDLVRTRRALGCACTVATVLLSGCVLRGDLTVIKLAHGLDTTHPVHAAMVCS